MLWLILCFVSVLEASFEVTAPNEHLLALRGQPVVLGCKFTPDPDLSNLVVTWQRNEDSRVVHSFYYQGDQLDRQSPEYQRRTSLFTSELYKGNASLRIVDVTQKDAGMYMCIVSSTKGTGKALMKVTYGALYSEPRLIIHLNSSALTVQFETEGFPKPEVIWTGADGQSLNHHLDLHDQTEDGLYFIKSRYEVQTQVVNVTFLLKNELLKQNLQRSVIFSYDNNKTANPYIAILVVLLLFSIALLICVIWLMRRRKKPRHSSEINHNHS